MCVCEVGGYVGGRVVYVGRGGSVHVYLHMPACPNLGAWEGDTHACIHACNQFACLHAYECDANRQVPLALTRWGDINK